MAAAVAPLLLVITAAAIAAAEVQSSTDWNSTNSCRLSLSDELFGGVGRACRTLDRSKCCPVLEAWIFAAYSKSALDISSSSSASWLNEDLPMMPDDSNKCVDLLQDALLSRGVVIPRPNDSCDALICACGIRLHKISSLSCPAQFNFSSSKLSVVPAPAVANLEHYCSNSSFSGCTSCLSALGKLEAGTAGGMESRWKEILKRDCQLMGLTWLLKKNKTKYIPTVSAVLRALMYSNGEPGRCSPDHDNMPLAVDALGFTGDLHSSASSSPFSPPPFLLQLLFFTAFYHLLLLHTTTTTCEIERKWEWAQQSRWW